MPWRPIQPNAAGLLSLLGLKNLGRQPESLLETVQPSMEMFRFFTEGRAEFVGGSFSVPMAGNYNATGFTSTDLQVPEGELWYVHHYHCEVYVIANGGTQVLTCEGLRSAILLPGTIPGSSFSGPTITSDMQGPFRNTSPPVDLVLGGGSISDVFVPARSAFGASQNLFNYTSLGNDVIYLAAARISRLLV